MKRLEFSPFNKRKPHKLLNNYMEKVNLTINSEIEFKIECS